MRPFSFVRFTALFPVAALCIAADWNPKQTAEFLDARQKAWFGWKRAEAAGGPCISCHTGLTYLLARPALRAALKEPSPTSYETGLRDGFIKRLNGAATGKESAAGLSVGTVL